MTPASIVRRSAWRAPAAISAIAMVITAAFVSQAGQARADGYPGQEQIQAAQAAVSSASADVTALDAAIADLEAALAEAEVAAQLAGETYVQAQVEADTAARDLEDAQQRAAEALERLDQARQDLGLVAQAAYREGTVFGSLEAVLTADGFEDVVARSEALSIVSSSADVVVQRVTAAELVAEAMEEQAADADELARATADVAAQAYSEAVSAQQYAADALTQTEQIREDALVRLAELHNTSVELQRQRQEGLAAERARAEREAWEAANGSGPGQQPSTPGAPTNPATPSTPGTPSTPDPAPTTPAAPDPAPTQPTAPAPEPTGNWRSSAAQGNAAADHALTLMGTDYKLAGNGPAYDCSGITYAAWRAAGYGIQRSSQSQYNSLTKVPLSQVRRGDLVFYGTGGDASRIYHVGIYVGNGMIAEATTPGNVAQVRPLDASWRIGNLIPQVGRV